VQRPSGSRFTATGRSPVRPAVPDLQGRRAQTQSTRTPRRRTPTTPAAWWRPFFAGVASGSRSGDQHRRGTVLRGRHDKAASNSPATKTRTGANVDASVGRCRDRSPRLSWFTRADPRQVCHYRQGSLRAPVRTTTAPARAFCAASASASRHASPTYAPSALTNSTRMRPFSQLADSSSRSLRKEYWREVNRARH